MKILAIRGKNIASLEGEYEVDFTKEPLLSNGIYTITGPTGSGKSTILDTISLALFNTTPRLKSAANKAIKDVGEEMISSNNSATMLRRGTSDGYAEVDFVAVDSDIYRTRWMVRRSRNKSDGKLQSVNYSIHNITKGTDLSCGLTESLNKISSLVGLTYDQFSRAVLLAQGEFSAFLKADDSSRASLLEKITGTEIFAEISKMVFEKKKEVQLSYDRIIDRMNDLDILSKEDFDTLLSDLEKSKSVCQSLKDTIEIINNKIKWHSTKKEIEDKIEISKNEIEKINKTIEGKKDIFSKLEILDEIRHFQDRYISLNNSISEIQENKTTISKKELLIGDLRGNIDVSLKRLNEAKETYNNFINSKATLRKEINEAIKIDNNIINKQKDLDKLNEDLEKKTNDKNKKNNDLETAKSNLNDKKKELENCRIWLENNKSLKILFENQQTIIQTLNQLSKQRKVFDDSLKKINSIKQDIKNDSKLIISIKKDIVSYESEFKKFDNKINDLNETIKDLDLDSLYAENKKYENLRDSLISLLDISKNIEIERDKVIGNDKLIANINSDNLKLKSELNSSVEKVSQIEIKFEQTEKIENEMRLRISKDVESLRASLIDNQECPVCGSKEHPYKSLNVSDFHSSFELYSQEKKKLQNEKDTHFALVNTLKEKICRNKETLNEKTEENNNSKIKIDSLLSDFHKNEDSSIFVSYIDNNLSTKISEKIESVKKGNAIINAKIEKLNQTNKEISSIKKENEVLQKKLNELVTDLKLKDNDIINHNKNMTEQNTVYENSASSILQLRGQIQDFFGNDVWWNEWKSNYVLYQNNFIKMTNEWNEYNNKLNNLTSSISLINEQIKGIEENYSIINKLLEELSIKGISVSEEIEKLKTDRAKYFDNKPVAIVEEELNKEEISLKESVESINKAHTSLENDLGIAESQKKQAEKNLLSFQNSEKQLRQNIDSNIEEVNQRKNLNINFDVVKEIFSIPGYQVKAWEDEKNKISESLITEKASLETHKGNLNEHLKSISEEIRSKEELIEEKNEKSNELEVSEQRKTALEYRIIEQKKNEESRKKLNDELTESRNVLDKWAKLNDTIGSADGNKFRVFAQGFTLDVLLQNANCHLKDIAPRYILQRIPNQLALQVVDRDMCDNVRSVYSLSGGETFLVSLGLALGLSSLSGKHMNIETLFIDEGFGSLDQETLSCAMDALESLRLQGKKVGVITHVKEMTERISAKVILEKKNNGASKISIQG